MAFAISHSIELYHIFLKLINLILCENKVSIYLKLFEVTPTSIQGKNFDEKLNFLTFMKFLAQREKANSIVQTKLAMKKNNKPKTEGAKKELDLSSILTLYIKKFHY